MKKELYPRLAACGVSWKIVELIERFGWIEPRELPVSANERRRYERALDMPDTPDAWTIADEDFPERLRTIPDPVYAL
ncbi:DNA-protecting protein DprA, partial [Maribellus luteus]